jgi:hypothetical protein
MEEAYGLLSFAFGGALLLFDIYLLIENTNASYLNTSLFAAYFILPIGFITFFFLGLGLYFILKSIHIKKPQQDKPHIQLLT